MFENFHKKIKKKKIVKQNLESLKNALFIRIENFKIN
jgi:hypothetical protein